MEEARAKTQASGNFLCVPHGMPHCLQRTFIFRVHGNVAKHREIISRTDSRQVRLQDITERLSARKRCGIFVIGKEFGVLRSEKRRLRRQTPRGFVLTRQLFRFDFAGFNVWLVECVDSDNRARNSGGNFPAEKFLAECVHVWQRYANHWIAGFFERCNCCILPLVRFVRELQIRENAIVPVGIGLRGLLAVHWNNSLANFARGFGNQLLKPCAEVENSWRSDDRDFVSTVIRRHSENRS